MDGISLHPTWVPLVSRASAEDQIDFNLQLMTGIKGIHTAPFSPLMHLQNFLNVWTSHLIFTDDWRFQRGSHSYFLGDPIHLEVSAIIGNHVPLRVYVDHCVATATPDAEATLRYDLIQHYG